MSTLFSLQNECETTLKEVNTKLEVLAKRLFEEDMQELFDEYVDRLSNKEEIWTLDDNIIIKFDKIGIDIEDRRGTAFLWFFEYDIDDIANGDSFSYNNTPYSVSFLSSDFKPEMEPQIHKVINNLKNSSMTLDRILKGECYDYSYSYYCFHEDVRCKSLKEVFEKVLERKYD